MFYDESSKTLGDKWEMRPMDQQVTLTSSPIQGKHIEQSFLGRKLHFRISTKFLQSIC
jgi:hypothetical protein